MKNYENCGFYPAPVCLPKKGTDMTKWAVIACDQYTSNQAYWDKVEKTVGEAPSALRLVLPEIYLGSDNEDELIKNINLTAESYVANGVVEELEPCYIYVERTLPDKSVRHGLIGMLDLELYDFSKGSTSAVRATEGTIVERIPPRLKVRENAALELPHIMVLIDNEQRNIIEALSDKKQNFEKLYEFELMQNGGRLAGYRVPDEEAHRIAKELAKLGDKENFLNKYSLSDCSGVLQYAVGDGNHSLATAKTHYMNKKTELSRYALCELVDLHDESLVFEAIHRTVFDTDVNALVDGFFAEYPEAKREDKPSEIGQSIGIIIGKTEFYFNLAAPVYKLAVATLQNFLDKYLKENRGRIDYIHGEDEARELASKPNSVSFILPAMDKKDLYPAVIADGALPRKTFSMGDADTKRFYNETRRIR